MDFRIFVAVLIGVLVVLSLGYRAIIRYLRRQYYQYSHDDLFLPYPFLTRAGICLGILAVLGAVILSWYTFTMERRTFFLSATKSLELLSRSLDQEYSSLPDSLPESDKIDLLLANWNNRVKPYPNAALCLIGNDGEILLHTADGTRIGKNVSLLPMKIFNSPSQTTRPREMLDNKKGGTIYLEHEGIAPQIVSYTYSPSLEGLIGVHIPYSSVLSDLWSSFLPWFVVVGFISLILFPFSLFLLNRGFRGIFSHSHRLLQRLQVSEERFRNIIKSSRDGILILSKESHILFANPAAKEMFGEPLLKTLENKEPVFSLLAPESRSAFESIHEDFYAREVLPKHPVEFQWLKGNLHIETTFSRLSHRSEKEEEEEESPDGELLLLTLRDVSDRYNHLEELSQLVSQLKATFESTADGILVADSDGKIQSYNKRFQELWNIPAEVLESRDDNRAIQYVLDQLTEPEEFVSKVRYLYDHTEETSYDLLRFKDGRVFERYSHPRYVNDKYVGRVWSFRDITAQTFAMRALEESEEKFRRLVEKSLVGVYIIQDGKFQYVNPRFCEIFGYSLSEIVPDMGPGDLCHPEDWPLVLENLQKRLAGELDSVHYSFRCLRKDGSLIHVEVYGSRTNLDGKPAVIGTLLDISERVRQERELRYRIDFESMLTTVSTRFMRPQSPDEIDSAISSALKISGEFLDADRCYIFRFSEDGNSMSNTHEWVREGTSAEITNLQNLPIEAFPWFYSRISGEKTVSVPNVDSLPPEASAEKEEWSREKILSLINFPLVHADKVIGFYGIDFTRKHREFSEEEISLLHILSDLFANNLIRLESEQNLRERELQFRTLTEESLAGFFLIRNDRFIYVNPAFESFFGYSRTELLGKKSLVDLTHPADQEQVRKLLVRQQESTDLIDRFEFQGVHKNSSNLYCEVLMRQIVFQGEKSLMGILLNITGRKLAQLELERFKNITDATSDIVGISDNNLNLIYLNRAGTNYLGVEASFSSGKYKVSRFHPPETWEFLDKTAIPQAIESGIWGGETVLKSLHGKEIPVSQVIITHKNESGELEYISTIARDISEHKQLVAKLSHANKQLEAANEQLNQVDRLRNEFVASISHDLRTPIAAIQGAIENFLSGFLGQLSPAQERTFEIILRNAFRLKRLINNLLATSQIEAGNLRFAPADTKINELIQNAVFELQTVVERKNIDLELHLSPTLPIISSDPDRVGQCIVNLLDNALRFAKHTVLISSEETSDGIAITVRDDGPGIPESDLGSVFDKYYRVESHGNRSQTGLGLSIVRNYVTMHGGNISARNADDGGAIFKITLPKRPSNHNLPHG